MCACDFAELCSLLGRALNAEEAAFHKLAGFLDKVRLHLHYSLISRALFTSVGGKKK